MRKPRIWNVFLVVQDKPEGEESYLTKVEITNEIVNSLGNLLAGLKILNSVRVKEVKSRKIDSQFSKRTKPEKEESK